MPTDETPTPPAIAGRDTVDATLVIPVLRETARIETREVESGRVRVHTTVTERDEVVEAILRQQDLHVERIPVGRVVDETPAVREEGGVVIIPVMEELLVVEKRLVLKEELRIRRSHGERSVRETVRLRTEEVSIEQTPAPSGSSAQPSPKKFKES